MRKKLYMNFIFNEDYDHIILFVINLLKAHKKRDRKTLNEVE